MSQLFSIILTWIGALLGIVVLLAMALGAFVLDFDDARYHRNEKRAETTPEHNGNSSAAPLA